MSRISDDELRGLLTQADSSPWTAKGGTIWAAGYKGRETNIATAHSRGPTTKMEPNARLIALAPQLAAEVLQLREALTDLLDACERMGVSGGNIAEARALTGGQSNA